MLGEKAVVRRRERQLWNAPRAPFFTHTLKVQSLRHCAGHLGSVISVRRPRRAGSYDTSALERSHWPHLLQGR